MHWTHTPLPILSTRTVTLAVLALLIGAGAALAAGPALAPEATPTPAATCEPSATAQAAGGALIETSGAEVQATGELTPYNPCYRFDNPQSGCFYEWRPSDSCCVTPQSWCKPMFCF